MKTLRGTRDILQQIVVRGLVLAAMAFAMAACDGGPNEPTDPTLGRYELITFEGKPIPAVTASDADSRYEIFRASITLASNYAYADSAFVRFVQSGVIVSQDTLISIGTWFRSQGTVVVLTPGPVHPKSPSDKVGQYFVHVDAGRLWYSDFVYMR